MSNAEDLLRAIVSAKNASEIAEALEDARRYLGPPKIDGEGLAKLITHVAHSPGAENEHRIDLFETNGFVVSVVLLDSDDFRVSEGKPDFSTVAGIVTY